MDDYPSGGVRIAVHLYCRALDRAFRAAESVQAEHPRATFEVWPECPGGEWAFDPDCTPQIGVLVYLDDAQSEGAHFSLPGTHTTHTMRREMVAAVRRLEGLSPEPGPVAGHSS